MDSFTAAGENTKLGGMPWRTFFADSWGQQNDFLTVLIQSVIYNNATLSFSIQLFLLHILGLSQLSREQPALFSFLKKPQMLLILEELLKFFGAGWAESLLSWPKCPLLRFGIPPNSPKWLLPWFSCSLSLQEAELWCSLKSSGTAAPGWGLRPLTEVGRNLILCTDHHSLKFSCSLPPGIAAVTPNPTWAHYTNNPRNEL